MAMAVAPVSTPISRLLPSTTRPTHWPIGQAGDCQRRPEFRLERDLLQGFSDVDGDELSVVNLRIAKGQGRLSAGDAGSWIFTPAANWNGTVALDYQVSDGQLLWQNPATTEVEHVERADFEGEYKAVANGLNRKGVFVASADGWESPTGAIEVKKDQDNQGQAASGESFVELNTDSAGIYPDAPAISKTIETTKGESYTLSLQYAGRPGFDENVNRFEVLIDGVSQGNWSQNNASTTAGSGTGGEHQWQNLKLNFTAQSDATAIEIQKQARTSVLGVDSDRQHPHYRRHNRCSCQHSAADL